MFRTGYTFLVIVTLSKLSLGQAVDEDFKEFEAIAGESPQHAYIREQEVERITRNTGAFIGTDAAPQDVLYQEHGVPVILVRSESDKPPYSIDYLEEKLFGTDRNRFRTNGVPKPTLRQYFLDMSYDKWPVTGRCYGWYKSDIQFETPVNSEVQRAYIEYCLIWDALKKADLDVDFSVYDAEQYRPRPNCDLDGFVDTIFIVHPRIGAERAASGHVTSVHHSHHSSLTTLAKYLKDNKVDLGEKQPPFVCDDIRRDVYGSRYKDKPEMVKIDDFCFLPALYTAPGTDDPIVPIGTFCHEYAHMLGLPDLYDRSPPVENRVKRWCLMSEGLHGHDGNSPSCPVPLSAWCRYRLGWSTPYSISNLNNSLSSIGASTQILKVPLPPTQTPWERFLLIEFRRNSQNQRAWKINWDQTLGGKTAWLTLWHVNESVGRGTSSDWPMAPKGKGQNDDANNPLVNFMELIDTTNKPITQEGFSLVLEQTSDDAALLSIKAKPEMMECNLPDLRIPANSSGKEFVALAQTIVKKLASEQPLSNAENAWLRAAPIHELPNFLPRDAVAVLNAQSQQARTLVVEGADFSPLNSDEKAVAERLKPWHGAIAWTGEPVQFRLSKNGASLERVEVANYPYVSIQSADDISINFPSEKLSDIDNSWRTLGVEATLKSVLERKDVPDRLFLQYEQSAEYAGDKLPIFDNVSVLQIEKASSKLVLADYKTTDPGTLKISGTLPRTNRSDLRNELAARMSVEVQRVSLPRTGLGILSEPNQARLGYEVEVSSGERAKIRVFVDGETKKVLYVR